MGDAQRHEGFEFRGDVDRETVFFKISDFLELAFRRGGRLGHVRRVEVHEAIADVGVVPTQPYVFKAETAFGGFHENDEIRDFLGALEIHDEFLATGGDLRGERPCLKAVDQMHQLFRVNEVGRGDLEMVIAAGRIVHGPA